MNAERIPFIILHSSFILLLVACTALPIGDGQPEDRSLPTPAAVLPQPTPAQSNTPPPSRESQDTRGNKSEIRQAELVQPKSEIQIVDVRITHVRDLSEILVQPGDRIEAGQALAQLNGYAEELNRDVQLIELELAQARAKLEDARRRATSDHEQQINRTETRIAELDRRLAELTRQKQIADARLSKAQATTAQRQRWLEILQPLDEFDPWGDLPYLVGSQNGPKGPRSDLAYREAVAKAEYDLQQARLAQQIAEQEAAAWRAVERLKEQALVYVTDNYNRHSYDRTPWFALNPEGFKRLTSVELNPLDSEVQHYKIWVPSAPMVLRIIPDLAEEIGLNESIVLLQIDYWIRHSDNVRDGRRWTFQSVRDMRQKAFRWWSNDTINRTIASLIRQRLILATDEYNQHEYQRTRWFALNPEGFRMLESVERRMIFGPTHTRFIDFVVVFRIRFSSDAGEAGISYECGSYHPNRIAAVTSGAALVCTERILEYVGDFLPAHVRITPQMKLHVLVKANRRKSCFHHDERTCRLRWAS